MSTSVAPHNSNVPGQPAETPVATSQSEEAQLRDHISTLRVVLLLIIVLCLAALGSLSLERLFQF